MNVQEKIVGAIVVLSGVVALGFLALAPQLQDKVAAQDPDPYFGIFTSMEQTKKDRVLDAFEAVYTYQEMVDDGQGGLISNPESLETFSERNVDEYVRGVLLAFEGQVASSDAYEVKKTEIEAFEF